MEEIFTEAELHHKITALCYELTDSWDEEVMDGTEVGGTDPGHSFRLYDPQTKQKIRIVRTPEVSFLITLRTPWTRYGSLYLVSDPTVQGIDVIWLAGFVKSWRRKPFPKHWMSNVEIRLLVITPDVELRSSFGLSVLYRRIVAWKAEHERLDEMKRHVLNECPSNSDF